MYKKYTRKQEIVLIVFILLLAVFSTYFIYEKFSDERKVDYNGDKIELVFNNENENKLTLLKVTPLNDSVGLSTESNNFTIKNNLTEKVKIKVLVEDDLETINNDGCLSYLITRDNIKIAIKDSNMSNYKILNMSELQNNILIEDTLNALEENNYSIRIWVNKDTGLVHDSDMHYHGLLKIVESDTNEVVNK